MQTILPSEFKPSMVVLLEGAPHMVEDFHLSGTAQTRHKLHTRLRHLKTGRVIDRVFAENERIPIAQIEHRNVQFSYKQGDGFVFMDSRSYDEITLTAEEVGQRQWFIKENEEYQALFLEGKLLDIILPSHVLFRVAETGPAQKGGFDSTWKAAKLEGGLEIMVPLFIAQGEVIKIDTRNSKYLGREAGG